MWLGCAGGWCSRHAAHHRPGHLRLVASSVGGGERVVAHRVHPPRSGSGAPPGTDWRSTGGRSRTGRSRPGRRNGIARSPRSGPGPRAESPRCGGTGPAPPPRSVGSIDQSCRHPPDGPTTGTAGRPAGGAAHSGILGRGRAYRPKMAPAVTAADIASGPGCRPAANGLGGPTAVRSAALGVRPSVRAGPP